MSGVMVITGASRGIGASTARLAALAGYTVCVNYRNDEPAANGVVADIAKNGGRAIAVRADVAKGREITELFAKVDRELGPLTALVNNVGILGAQCRVEQLDEERINRVLTANVTGYFLCAKEAVLRMSTAHGGAGGTIVNVSSAASRTGSPGEYVDYAASKGAVDTFTRGLSLEVADQGIRVNCVRPGFIHTDIHASGGDPGRVDRLAPNIPMKRGGTTDEVAEAILWLSSEKSSYCTGSYIDLAGGR